MEAKYLCKLVFLTVAFVVVQCRPTESDIRLWKEHQARASKFMCDKPRPTSVNFGEFEEFKDKTYLRFSWEILPSSTVLYRCEGSGCCKGQKKCQALATEDVELVFRIREGHKMSFHTIKATNHTKCGCHEDKMMPK